MAAVNHDPNTNELRFDPNHFGARPAAPFVSWTKGMRRGKKVNKGTIVATVRWDDGFDEPIKAPAGGTILSTNRRIRHSRLHKKPAQLALIFQ
jgi:hypothetical protein